MPKRKQSPNQLANLKPGIASKGGKVSKELTLLPSTITTAEALGTHGTRPSCSDGIDRLFAKLPVFARCKVLLALIADNPGIAESLQADIEAVLYDLEDLEIEHAYEESITENVIKTPGGSWIV